MRASQSHHPRRTGSCPIPSGRRQQDAAQGVYMGNKFLALRKSEVAKVAPDRAGILGFPADWRIGEQGEFREWWGNYRRELDG